MQNLPACIIGSLAAYLSNNKNYLTAMCDLPKCIAIHRVNSVFSRTLRSTFRA